MIRKANENDYDSIDLLGSTLKENFDVRNRSNLEEVVVYGEDENILGFVQFIKLYETIEILYLVVDPSNRRKGIGRALVEYLSKLNEAEKIILEVRKSNELGIEFYEGLDFKVLREIKNYYKNGEDAYAMEKVL